MRRLFAALSGWLAASLPSLALAEGAGGGYQGIASLYYSIIALILIYGVYDTFGKKLGSHIGAAVIVIGAYALTQMAPE